jgi:hypothetical protein
MDPWACKNEIVEMFYIKLQRGILLSPSISENEVVSSGWKFFFMFIMLRE